MDINDAWKSTCKILLGDEVGDIERYRAYLTKYIVHPDEKRSALSGKSVTVTPGDYSKGARFISMEEAEQYRKTIANSIKLDINQIKDFDSILEALDEKLYYCGNIVLGNSTNVQNSTGCQDSSFVYESNHIWDNSKYVAFTNNMRLAEFVFGSMEGGENKFLIKGYGPYRNTRCFEALRSKPASDCYYISNLQGCSNCMFSFNLRSVNFAIGNLVLPKEEYMKLKGKLVEDIRQTLADKKEVPTIIDIIANSRVKTGPEALQKSEILISEQDASTAIVPNGFERVEAAFQNATGILFGKKLSGLKDYRAWLEEYDLGNISAKSAVSGEDVYAPAFSFYLPLVNNFVRLREALTLGNRMKIAREKIETLNLENAPAAVGKLAYVSPEIVFGRSMNIIECGDYQDSVNVFRGSFVFDSKNIACAFFPKFCEDVYGCYKLLYCKYCVRCKNSTNLNRCFEVTDSNNCSDSYFCHNSENLQECMLCFNAKSLRYAVGGIEIGREKYLKIKKLMLENIVDKLEKNKRLVLSIYNAGCYKQNSH